MALLTCEAFDRQGLSLISIQPYALSSKSKDKYQETQDDYEQIFNGDTPIYGLEGAIDTTCTRRSNIFAQSIDSAINKGAQVINISVGDTLATIKGSMSNWLNQSYDLCLLAKKEKWDSVEKIDEQIKVILEALHKLKGEHPDSKIEDIDSQIIATYQEKAREILHPILQEAENKKIPIVIATGNEFWGKTENHDFLCRVAHETAFIMGSANSKGIVSAKSSHSDYLTVAGNGEGLQYQNFVEPNKLSLNWKIVFSSLTLLQKRYQELIPGSTSIAAADASTLIAQIRRINPDLSPSEIKAIICETAIPSRFSFWRKLLRPGQNISHYSGAGLVSRVAAIEEAKEQRVL